MGAGGLGQVFSRSGHSSLDVVRDAEFSHRAKRPAERYGLQYLIQLVGFLSVPFRSSPRVFPCSSLQCRDERMHEFGGAGSIDNSMIAGKR